MKGMLEESGWRPCWIRGSRIDEIVWIGKDVLAWCSGLCIIFFQTLQKRETLRWCWSQKNTGEGAHCLSGHVSVSIFAFSEKILEPKILVFSYPTMTKITECLNGCDDYLATAFTSRDHLISLGNYPDFQMIVWSWRTGEKMAVVDTSIRDEVGQILRISQTGPTLIAQMGKTCGRLFIWDLHVVGKLAMMKGIEIKLPKDAPVYGVDWSPEPGEPLLAITDVDGHIYLSDQDGTNVYRIVLSQRCGICIDIERPAVCWFRGSIVLKTTYCQIRSYKRNPEKNVWRKEWHLKTMTKPCIMVSHPFKNDHLFCHTLEGYLMQVHFPSEENPVIERRLHYGAVYKHVDFIYPWAHHLAAVDDDTDLAILECYSGKQVSRLNLGLQGQISCQAAHPSYPLLLVTSNKGELVLVNLLEPENPTIATCIRLYEGPLDFIKFSERGKFVLVAEKKSGTCFCIKLFEDNLFKVMAQVQSKTWMTDAFLYEVNENLKLLILYATLTYLVGNDLLVYNVSGNKDFIDTPATSFNIPGLYRNLCYAPENSQTLIGSPYLTRQLHTLIIQEWKTVSLSKAMATGHQVRQASVFSSQKWVCTTALDGLVILRDKNLRTVSTIMTHHRYDLGATKAIVSPEGKLIIALGSNGSLVAMKTSSNQKENLSTTDDVQDFYRVDFGIYERQRVEILSDYDNLDPKIVVLFSRLDESLKDLTDKTWVQWREELRIKKEAEECARERASILRDFEELRTTVVRLLDENETRPELEQLPVSEFDLHKLWREQTLKTARDERENLRMELEAKCEGMDQVTAWIKKTFWDRQKILARSILAIYGTDEVTNYPMANEDFPDEERLRWAKFERESVRYLLASETFKPWQSYTDVELEMELSKRAQLYREDERRRMDMLLEEEEREEDADDLEDKRAYEGMTTHRFVEPSPYYFSQLESYSPDHVRLDNQFLMDDSRKLRLYFNKLFDDMYALKEREMTVVKERINEIRRIDSDLKLMFNESVPDIPLEPEWHWREKPETLLVVEVHEVKAKPYVSPSQQELLDKQAAEEERQRQLLLADDFRERALVKMMDGVLEVRWEDTIKLDVPKPNCMLTKKPEEYTIQDIAEVRKYEKDVEFREHERQRYKRILEADYTRIFGLLKQGVDKFNAKLKDFVTVKLKVEAALNQMNLRYARGCLRTYEQVKALEGEEKLKEEISEKRKNVADLEVELGDLERACQTLRSQYDSLGGHEKTFGRKFKLEFSLLGRISLEALARHYRYRPKTNLRNVMSSDLLDLGKHVTAKTMPPHLPPECVDYLRHLNVHDNRPANIPDSVQDNHWNLLVRLRRQRINQELKQRSKLVEISEAERAIGLFKEKISRSKRHLEETMKNLQERRKARVLAELDAEIQLVLKLGQVERSPDGNLEDMANAILIPRGELDAVNERIRAGEASLLEARLRTEKFRERIRLKEWRHECLRLDLAAARDELREVRGVLVTKEMQDQLKSRSMKVRRGDGQDAERVQLATNRTLDRVLRERLDRLADLEDQIESMKRKNARLHRVIEELNVDRCELELSRDLVAEQEDEERANELLGMIVKRSAMVREIQKNYTDITALQTELELLRLKRFPLLEPFKPINEDKKEKPVP